MKAPASTQFGIMSGARNSRGAVTVCGEVNGRNGDGAYVGMAPYVGVLMGTRASPDFVVVGIAGVRPRARRGRRRCAAKAAWPGELSDVIVESPPPPNRPYDAAQEQAMKAA